MENKDFIPSGSKTASRYTVESGLPTIFEIAIPSSMKPSSEYAGVVYGRKLGGRSRTAVIPSCVKQKVSELFLTKSVAQSPSALMVTGGKPNASSRVDSSVVADAIASNTAKSPSGTPIVAIPLSCIARAHGVILSHYVL